MRFFSIITAILVMAAVYMLIFEREKVFEFASTDSPPTSAETKNQEQVPATADREPEPTTGHVVSVVAIKSVASEIADAVLVRGRTEAARQVDVRAETSGQVISDPLRKGAQVEKAQLLCQLDPGTREISLTSSEARLAEARARQFETRINLNAAKRLSEGGFASESRLAAAEAANETANAGIQAAQAAVAAAKREIQRLTITAPFSGLLESDAAETGTLLQPGSLCATVIQLNPIKLVGFVPEIDVARVKVGVAAGARLATGDDVTGQVTFLSRSADPTTRTFRVEMQVPNDELSIRDGQTAEILISSAGQDAHLLPFSSLTLNDDGQLGVRTVSTENLVKFLPVSVVRDTIDGIWVSGLPDLVNIITIGQEYVVDGVPVKVTYEEPNQ